MQHKLGILHKSAKFRYLVAQKFRPRNRAALFRIQRTLLGTGKARLTHPRESQKHAQSLLSPPLSQALAAKKLRRTALFIGSCNLWGSAKIYYVPKVVAVIC